MASLLSTIETKARRHLKEPAALSTPGAPTVTPQGTAQNKTYTYKIVAINATGTTDAGSAGSTTTGHATLDGTNYNRLTWTAVSLATGYWIYRTVAGGTSPTTTGRIVVLGAVTTYDDQGAAGDSATAPTTNTSGLSAPFWSSEELIDLQNLCFKDLWGAIVDLHQEHYLTVDITNVSISASTATLSGVPSDVFRVHLIEPKTTASSGSYKDLLFVPRDYNSADFIAARALGDADPGQAQVINYCLSSQGAPVAAPTVHIGPTLNSAIAAGQIRFVYVPVLAAVTSSGDNPIPGDSDNAIIAWTVAYARAKEREDRSPDPNWLAVYATEKQNLLTRLTPRQTQEPDLADALFQNLW